jgi:aldose sugar dehydrogenase
MKLTKFAVPVAALAILSSPAACQEGRPAGPERQAREATGNGDSRQVQPVRDFRVETVVQDVEVPWTILWLPDGRMMFTERPGRVRIVADGQLREQPVYIVPDIIHRQGAEIGLMGMTLHPQFEQNRMVYLVFGHTDGDVRIVRYTLEDGDGARLRLEEDRIIIRVRPAGMNHAGSRIAFGPDGKLYMTTGEAFRRDLAQDMTSLSGKTLRLNDDGSVPDDNPFNTPEAREKGWRPEIWSLGHRNAQGMDWHPETGLMYQTEHGPSGERGADQDELNLVERGRNYGWPIITGMQEREGLEMPLVEWTPAIAPGSGTFYKGELFPEMQNNYLVGGLRGQVLLRIVIDDKDPRQVLRQERLIEREYGRIREVAVGPDGAIYFATSNRDGRGRPAENDDRILRIVGVEPR